MLSLLSLLPGATNMDTSLAVLKHSSTFKQTGYVSVCRRAQDATKEPPNNPNKPINLKGMHAQLELAALLQTSAANPTRFNCALLGALPNTLILHVARGGWLSVLSES